MAMTCSQKWIYPPNYQSGNYPVGLEKARGPKRWAIILLGEATATEDETEVTKIRLADLRTIDGRVPSRFQINRIVYEMRGFTGLHLNWDRTPTKVRFFSTGGINRGEVDYTRYGGLSDLDTGGTGDLQLSTTGGSQYDTYNLMIEFEVKV